MKKGFTLIELMIVVAIITILATISAPKFSNLIKKAVDARVFGMLGALRSASNFYHTDEFEHAQELKDIITNVTHYELLTEGITYTSSSAITSYQMQAGTVKLSDGTVSKGTKGELNNKDNISEIYYNNLDGLLYIDGTTGSGIGFLDTRGKRWKDY